MQDTRADRPYRRKLLGSRAGQGAGPPPAAVLKDLRVIANKPICSLLSRCIIMNREGAGSFSHLVWQSLKGLVHPKPQ
jgi:hypothetical protein